VKVAHLNGLRAFEATLRTGNLRAAADELGVTPAAVGQQIRVLEDYLGRKLFTRSQKGMHPTAAAKDVESELRSGLIAMENVLGKLQKKQRVQRLKLTIDQPIYETWLARHITEFQTAFPEIELITDISNRMVDLLAEDFDFAIRFAPEQPDDIDSITLFPVGHIPICTPDFASRYRLPQEPTSLAGVPLFHIEEKTADPAWIDWQGWCELNGVEFGDSNRGMQFTRHSFGYQAARSGLGLALCGLLESYEGLRDGSVIMPFAPRYSHPCEFMFRLVWVHGRRQSAAHRQFCEWLVKNATEFRAETEAFFP
jgi:LysR family glycine cleavage system transcriptional activator